MQKSHVTLSGSDRQELSRLLHQSDLRSRVLRRASMLLERDKGRTVEEVQGIAGLSYPPVAGLIK